MPVFNLDCRGRVETLFNLLTVHYLFILRFRTYISNSYIENLDKMQSSSVSRNMNIADEMLKNNGERSLAKIF
jgi:hypothetical protein